MLYLDTCVLLVLLTAEFHSVAAAAFLEPVTDALAIRSWTITEWHSALLLKVRT